MEKSFISRRTVEVTEMMSNTIFLRKEIKEYSSVPINLGCKKLMKLTGFSEKNKSDSWDKVPKCILEMN